MRTRKQLEEFSEAFNIKPQNEKQWKCLADFVEDCDKTWERTKHLYSQFNIQGKIMDNWLEAVKKCLK